MLALNILNVFEKVLRVLFHLKNRETYMQKKEGRAWCNGSVTKFSTCMHWNPIWTLIVPLLLTFWVATSSTMVQVLDLQ